MSIDVTSFPSESKLLIYSVNIYIISIINEQYKMISKTSNPFPPYYECDAELDKIIFKGMSYSSKGDWRNLMLL
jgi:hypothetical protein